jgi:hypothetical protein
MSEPAGSPRPLEGESTAGDSRQPVETKPILEGGSTTDEPRDPVEFEVHIERHRSFLTLVLVGLLALLIVAHHVCLVIL